MVCPSETPVLDINSIDSEVTQELLTLRVLRGFSQDRSETWKGTLRNGVTGEEVSEESIAESLMEEEVLRMGQEEGVQFTEETRRNVRHERVVL